MGRIRPNVLTIAGFDPSSGAGLTADIKTFEKLGVYGFSACTALTFQSANVFESVNWVETNEVKRQVALQLQENNISVVKIGLVQNIEQLTEIVAFIKAETKAKIVLDPILKASAGFDFELGNTVTQFNQLLSQLDVITPNWDEAKQLIQSENPSEALLLWSEQTSIYLKGGHRTDAVGTDVLFTKGKTYAFKPKRYKVFEKHGSGCVFSAALTAFLAKGYPLNKACLRAKDYTARFLASNHTLLGYHS